MINRRTVIFGAAASAIAGVILVATGREHETKAAAAAAPIAFTYKGHSVTVTISDGMAMVTIDGKKNVHVDRNRLGRFHTHMLPFQEYSDARRLAMDLIEIQDARLVIL